MFFLLLLLLLLFTLVSLSLVLRAFSFNTKYIYNFLESYKNGGIQARFWVAKNLAMAVFFFQKAIVDRVKDLKYFEALF